MARASVMLATPCYGGMVAHIYMQSVIRLMSYAADRNFTLELATSAHDSLITRARNALVARFLDSSSTHLMFIDADTGFAPEQFERLLNFNEGLVAGMYPVKVIHWPQVQEKVARGVSADVLPQTGLNYVGLPCKGAEREERDGFVTGTYAGTGFMLIRRDVIEQMIKAYPETHFKSIQTYPLPKNPSSNQYNLFDCIIEPETGTYLSEDFTFCHRWRKIGGKIWLDQRSDLTHVGPYEFRGTPALSQAV